MLNKIIKKSCIIEKYSIYLRKTREYTVIINNGGNRRKRAERISQENMQGREE